jgi:hypothetical protein
MARRWSKPKTGWVRPLVKPEPAWMEWAWEEWGRVRRVSRRRGKNFFMGVVWGMGGWMRR